jgi:hypothetical protein
VVPRPGPTPGTDYDPRYLYLPEQAPDRRPQDDVCGPLGRWWVTPELDLSWVPTRPAPTNLRLRIADPNAFGQTLPGPHLPTAGLSTERFEPAFGLAAGVWFDEAHTHGMDASFFTRDSNVTFTGFAPGAVVLFPNGTGRSVPQVVTVGPPVVGVFPATTGTYFATVDVNYRHNVYCDGSARLDALVGYRYAFLGDELYLGDLPDGGHDEFRLNRASVSNNFHAGQIGLAGEYRAGGWYVAGAVKMAFGTVTSEVNTTGMFNGAQGRVGNSWQRLDGLTMARRSDFAVMPSLNVQLGRQISPHIRLYTGYSFTFLSHAARLGDALNPLNTSLASTNFWVQSIGFGAEFRF